MILDDEAKSGLQAYVVAASSKPLPPYVEWRKTRTGVSWKALPPGKTVWEADSDELYQVNQLQADRNAARFRIEEVPGVPPLMSLCRSLKDGGVEAVEAIAFPVFPKEGER